MNTDIQTIENHLKKPKGVIAVSQGDLKLQKPGATIDRFNYTYADVLAVAPSLEAFLKQLPQHGFTTGAILSLRYKHGQTTKLVAQTELTLTGTPAQPPIAMGAPAVQPPAPSVPEPSPAPSAQHIPVPAAPIAQPPVAALGYANVPMHEFVSLSVLRERYNDVADAKAKAEKRADEAESALRIEKEKNASLQIKLDSIKDRHAFAIERTKADRKRFWDTNTGQEVVGKLAGNIPQILAALRPQPQMAQLPQQALANPFAGMTEVRQAFIEAMGEVPDDYLELVELFAAKIMSDDEYRNQVLHYFQTMNNG